MELTPRANSATIQQIESAAPRPSCILPRSLRLPLERTSSSGVTFMLRSVYTMVCGVISVH